jgi:hypothetical protein
VAAEIGGYDPAAGDVPAAAAMVGAPGKALSSCPDPSQVGLGLLVALERIAAGLVEAGGGVSARGR